MSSRNLTLSLPDELVRRAKVLAAERDTSVSALVAGMLRRELDGGEDYVAAWEAEARLMKEGVGLRVGEVTWSRADLHER